MATSHLKKSAGSAKAAPAKSPAPVTAAETKKVSAAARDRAESLLAEVERRKQRIAEDFYDIGQALQEIVKRKLFSALGYATFAEMLNARNVMGLSQAHKLIRLVGTVPRDQALALGQEKAIAILDYARATPELDTPGSLVEGGALPRGKRVAEASVRELREATTEVRKKAGKARRPSPEQASADREASALQAWLRKRGAKKATASVVRRDGELWIRMEVPAAAGAGVRS